MLPMLEIIPPEIATQIAKALQESYSSLELDKSVYSLALTCRAFYIICQPLLYSRYSNENKTITELSQFIQTLVSRPDLWYRFENVSIEWNCRTSRSSLKKEQHNKMLADVEILKKAIELLPNQFRRLDSQSYSMIKEELTMEPLTLSGKGLTDAFKHIVAVTGLQTYAELLIAMLTFLAFYIKKLQIKVNVLAEYDVRHRWLSRIFYLRQPNALIFPSLEEVHYVTATSRRLKFGENVFKTKLGAKQLDIFMEIIALKSLKVDGFAFESDWPSRWASKPGSCLVESLDLMYNFNVHFVEWRIFLSVFRNLKHFSYDGNFRDIILDGRRIDGSVTPEFLGKLMQGIFVHRESLESLSLMGICRLKSDHTHLKTPSTPGFTDFPRLKHVKIQLDLFIGMEDESVGFLLHELLPDSLETLELWSQASLDCMSFANHLSELTTYKENFPGFALREIKFVYVIEKLQVVETWKNDIIKDLGKNGIHLVFVGLSGEDVWWASKPEN